MKASGYPNAGAALDIIENRIAKQQQEAQMQAELMAQQEAQGQGGMENEMPVM